MEKEHLVERDVYIWGCGIINSLAPVDKMIPKLVESKPSVYILKLDSDAFEQSS